jgi:homoserine O-acetyltransferase
MAYAEIIEETAKAESDLDDCLRYKEFSVEFERPDHPGVFLTAKGRLVGNKAAPAVIVIGGISATRRLLTDDDGAGWWPGVASLGGALNPTKLRLLSFDFIDDRAKPYPTPADQAEAVLALANMAGLADFSLVGASYGGSIALEVAARAPHRARKVAILCAAAKANPMARVWRSIQHEMIELALEAGQGPRGVDLARRLAMTIYRTHEEFDQRFYDPKPDSRDASGVLAYISSRGVAYSKEVCPHRYLALSHSVNSADVEVEKVTSPTRFFAISRDQLVPPTDIRLTAARIEDAQVTEYDSLYGHDGFLKEPEAVNAFLREAL